MFTTNVATERCTKLAGPQEVVGFLEVGTASVDLVNDVFQAHNAKVAKVLLDNHVVYDWNALLIDLGVATLVAQLLHGLQARVTVGDEGLNPVKHVDGGLVKLHEDAIVNLAEAKELQNLADLGVDANDTTDAHDECDLGAGLDVDVALGLGGATEVDLTLRSGGVLLGVLFGVGLRGGISSLGGLVEGSLGLGISCLKALHRLRLLGDRFRDAARSTRHLAKLE